LHVGAGGVGVNSSSFEHAIVKIANVSKSSFFIVYFLIINNQYIQTYKLDLYNIHH